MTSSEDDNTLSRQPEQVEIQNSVGTELPKIPTSEYLRGLIDRIAECRDLAVGRALNIPIRACIEYVLRNTGLSRYKELQYDFVRAVALVLLNAGRPDGSQVRQPRHGQVESIRRVVYRLGDTILNRKDRLWQEHRAAGSVSDHGRSNHDPVDPSKSFRGRPTGLDRKNTWYSASADFGPDN